MHRTPKKIFDEISRERPPCERNAIFHDHECGGRSTMEHVWIYAGRQIDEKWAIIRLCEKAHSVGPYQNNGILNKEKNRYISLIHASDIDLAKYPKVDWRQIRAHLGKQYGKTN